MTGVAKGYHCQACTESRLPRLFPVSSQDDSEPGRHAAIDNFYWEHPVSHSWCRGTVLVDRGSRHVCVYLHQVEPEKRLLGNTVASEVMMALDSWMKHMGRFETLLTDPEGCFCDWEFRNWLSDREIMWLPCPGEAHWKNGLAERMVQMCKESATRCAKRLPPDTPMQLLFDGISSAHGDLYRSRGFSPFQLLHGRLPPGLGLDLSTESLPAMSRHAHDTVLAGKLLVKQHSYRAYLEHVTSNREAAQRLHQNRPLSHWKSGDIVWYWRNSDKKVGGVRTAKKNGMYRGPAKVMLQERKVFNGQSVPTSTVWIVDGVTLIRCSAYHLRAATTTEILTENLSNTELKNFEDLSKTLKKGVYLDLMSQTIPTPVEEFEDDGTVPTRSNGPVEVREASREDPIVFVPFPVPVPHEEYEYVANSPGQLDGLTERASASTGPAYHDMSTPPRAPRLGRTPPTVDPPHHKHHRMVSLEFPLTEGEIEDLAKDTMTAFIGLTSSHRLKLRCLS